MTMEVGRFLDEQRKQRRQIHKDFCKFVSDPMSVEDATLEIIDRFPGIKMPAIAKLLEPWFVESLVELACSELLEAGKLGMGFTYQLTRRSN